MASSPSVLIAGATGFIGRRLAKELASRDVRLRCLSRSGTPPVAGVEAVAGDLLDPQSLTGALQGIETAYYLVHSLDAAHKGFAAIDRRAAENFRAAAAASGLQRVVYLSGLGDSRQELSAHLLSRMEVAGILADGPFQATVLRAAIIIGAGSASFEILRFLVKTQLLLPNIAWLDTRCQPIAVDNVISYLAGCLSTAETAGRTFDIGGPDILTYRDMLEAFAAVARTRNLFVPVPFYSPRVAARLISRLSRIDRNVALALLEGMANEVVCHEESIRALLPQRLLPYPHAVRAALEEREGARPRRPAR